MRANVNKEFIRELSDDELKQAQIFVSTTFSRMNDRQFLDWVKNLYPEAGGGQVNIGIAIEDGVVYRFYTKDILSVINTELDKRMGAERVRPNQVVVTLPDHGNRGYDPIQALKQFMDAFQEYANKGPVEPELYSFRDQQPVINADWITWHSAKYAVDRKTSWKAAAVQIAKELGKDLEQVSILPDEINPLKLVFAQTIDQMTRV